MLGPGMFAFSTAMGTAIALRSLKHATPRMPALFVLLALALPLTYYGGGAALVLIQQAATARSRGPVTITGEVVDQSGAPVEDYDVASFWSANGVLWDKYGNNMSPDPSVWTDEGAMEPMPNATALPLPQGCFRLQFPEEREVYSLVAMSKNRNMGGIVLVGREAAKSPAVISVHALVNVHGSIICRENGVVPRLTDVFLYPASDEGNIRPAGSPLPFSQRAFLLSATAWLV